MLPERDTTYLATCWPAHEMEAVGQQVAVILPSFELPAGFEPRVVDLLLMIPFGYPDTPLDMFWVAPAVVLHGGSPQATSSEVHVRRPWQRFSRHLPAGVWRPGVDGVQSYLALVRTMLEREAGPAAEAA